MNNSKIDANFFEVKPFKELENLYLYNINIFDSSILQEYSTINKIKTLEIMNFFVNNSIIEAPLLTIDFL